MKLPLSQVVVLDEELTEAKVLLGNDGGQTCAGLDEVLLLTKALELFELKNKAAFGPWGEEVLVRWQAKRSSIKFS
jgi:hypothetical protein